MLDFEVDHMVSYQHLVPTVSRYLNIRSKCLGPLVILGPCISDKCPRFRLDLELTVSLYPALRIWGL